MIAIKKIMVPTDFSETSRTALTYGKAVAEAFHASLHVVHVLEDMIRFYPPAMEGYTLPPQFSAEMEKETRAELNKTLTDAERRMYDAQIVLLRGNPYLGIIDFAKKQSIDLIVMGTHGRGPIGHMLLGNVAEKVVRKAPCPVLTVRPGEHAFVNQ